MAFSIFVVVIVVAAAGATVKTSGRFIIRLGISVDYII